MGQSRIDRLMNPRPVAPDLQTEGKIIHHSIAKLSPGLSVGDLVSLRSAGPCFINSVDAHGRVEVAKKDGSRVFTMLPTEFSGQFQSVLDYAAAPAAS
jgi:hypothetical protein